MIDAVVGIGVGMAIAAGCLAIGWGLAKILARPSSGEPPVDYGRINRLEFELGIPFSSRPDTPKPPEVHAVGRSYDVVCRGCGYTSIRHLTEAGAKQRAREHYREHLDWSDLRRLTHTFSLPGSIPGGVYCATRQTRAPHEREHMKGMITAAVLASTAALTITAGPAAQAATRSSAADCEYTNTILAKNIQLCGKAVFVRQTDGDGGANVYRVRVGMSQSQLNAGYCNRGLIEDGGFLKDGVAILSDSATDRWDRYGFSIGGWNSTAKCVRWFNFTSPVRLDRNADLYVHGEVRVKDSWNDTVYLHVNIA